MHTLFQANVLSPKFPCGLLFLQTRYPGFGTGIVWNCRSSRQVCATFV